MGNDKTSWLNLDNDDDDLNLEPSTDGLFTETLPNSGPLEETHMHKDTPGGVDRKSEMRTTLEPTVEKTEIYHAGKADQYAGNGGFDPMTDPIVGWLVVVKGPGLGQSVSLGSGMNTLGRDGAERAALDFGDTLISGKDHLRIIYDDANRAFFVAPGSGRNISRMNGQIVATTAALDNYALLELSKQTHVRFVAFCNEQFDWADLPNDA